MSDFALDVGIKGLDKLDKQLGLLVQELPHAVGRALRAEAEIEMTEAKRRTPVDTGALRDSGTVEGPDSDGVVRMYFGGPSAPYAVVVHEDLEAFHDDGQAKFLESVLMESVPYLAERVAARMAGQPGESIFEEE
jgi:allophanate hydrolase subunit 2